MGGVQPAIPDFGRGCYIDTTPLPDDAADNPFNALSSHGVGSVGIQTRLAFVVDADTGLPIWFDLLPGNILDFQNLKTNLSDVRECLDIEIRDFVLDAGYVCQEMVWRGHKKRIIYYLFNRKNQ